MHGEWFVKDYFTVDGDAEIAATLDGVTPAGATLPHQNPVGSSYVEWARALAVSSREPSQYLVEIAFRTVFSSDGETFARAPVRAVAVAVSVDLDGTTTISGLPAPAELPAMAWKESAPGIEEEAPVGVAAEALALGSAFGEGPVVADSRRDGSDWRFVVEVGDASGNRWPLAVSVADS